MLGVVLSESAKIQPMGWALIIGFVVILVVGVIIGSKIDKKNSSQFDAEVDKQFADKLVCGNRNIFITSDNELVLRYKETGRSGYKLYPLNGVKYIMSCWDSSTKCWRIGLYNEKKKLVAGEDHKAGKKKVFNTKASFPAKSESVEFLEMIMKYTPDAELVGLYFKEYKGSLKK